MLDRLTWAFGSSFVAASVAQGAVIAHGLNKFEPNLHEQQKLRVSLDAAKNMTMLNGLGMCLIALRGRTGLAAVPAGLLLTGNILFPGILWYELHTKDKQFHSYIKFGGMSTIVGWFTMALL